MVAFFESKKINTQPTLNVYTFLLLFFSISFAANAQQSEFPCENDSAAKYFGFYKVTEVVEYAKGINDESELEQFIATELVIQQDLFEYEDIVIKQPFYYLDCFPGYKEEGQVSPYRWSTHFHGFGWQQRDEIKTILVFEKDNDGEFTNVARLEVISNSELWEGQNFWFLRFIKPKDL